MCFLCSSVIAESSAPPPVMLSVAKHLPGRPSEMRPCEYPETLRFAQGDRKRLRVTAEGLSVTESALG
jgi:hypothetical protein